MGARLSWPGYSKAIAMMISKGGVDWRDLVDAGLTAGRLSAQFLLRDLNALKLAHIIEWVVDRDDGRTRRPRMAFGLGDDVPYPGTPRKRMRTAPRPELIVFASVIRALMGEPRNGKMLAEATGTHPRSARAAIRALRAEKLVYIDSYEDRGPAGAGYPLFAWGPGQVDAKKPRPRSARNVWNAANDCRGVRDATVAVLHAIAGTRQVSARRLQRSADKIRVAVGV